MIRYLTPENLHFLNKYESMRDYNYESSYHRSESVDSIRSNSSYDHSVPSIIDEQQSIPQRTIIGTSRHSMSPQSSIDLSQSQTQNTDNLINSAKPKKVKKKKNS